MSELLVHGDANLWSMISAGVFLFLFSLLLCWVYLPARKDAYGRAAKLPLNDE